MGGRIAQHFYFARPDRVATLTLAEASGTPGPGTMEAAKKAVDGLMAAQTRLSGWKAGKGKDATVDAEATLWAAMTLKSAKVAGLPVSMASPMSW